ncbi:ATP-dependent DNA helicase [Mycoplasmopsis opalescens]|uniref:ATP-dependent DNA helicase n=1 Tax=Mycoplasmopsis opalescens TaxID=114886 RepID=UPI0004A76520|nr:AAA family ATPase [Mycoplasmopsis opalescens]
MDTEGVKNFIGRFTKILSGGEAVNWKYALLLFNIENGKQISVYCKDKKVDLNLNYEIFVKENSNGKYNSFILENFLVKLPNNNEKILQILKNSTQGLGEVRLKKIVEACGEDFFNNIQAHKDKIIDLTNENLYDKLASQCLKMFENDQFFFIENGLSNLFLMIKELNKFKEISLLNYFETNDPYELVVEHYLPFDLVDKLACIIGKKVKFNRLRSMIYYFIRDEFNSNSTLVPIVNIVNKILKYENSYTEADVFDSLVTLIENQEVYFDKDNRRISLFQMYDIESEICDILCEINEAEIKHNYKRVKFLSCSELQNKAINDALKNNVSIISGYPGTGKTLIIEKIYNQLIGQKAYSTDEIKVLTPTGRSASNLFTKYNINAKTCHSYLKISRDNEVFENYVLANNETKVIIFDEFSMININIFAAILRNTINLEKVIIVGDSYQLPAIGPGNLLEDLVNSKRFNTTILEDIFRTDSIEISSHFLGVKSFKFVEPETDIVQFVDADKNNFIKQLTIIFANHVYKYLIDETMVLVPIYKGEKGIIEINKALQKWYIFDFLDYEQGKKATKLDFSSTDKTFYIGDKVIQTENDYNLDVYNGEIGYISEYNDKGIIVDFIYKKILYKKNDFLKYIQLAYAITIHKFQGSESKSIIFPFFSNYDFMLTNKLIYTAVSRAKEKLTIIGDSGYYSKKVTDKTNNKEIFTFMQKMLTNK